MRHLRRHLFLLIGLLTYALFLLVGVLGDNAQALASLMRIVIVPMYLAWMLVTMIIVAIFGPSGPPGLLGPVVWVVDLAAGLAPYLLADYLVGRWRRAVSRKRDTNA